MDPTTLSIKELKARITELGGDPRGCVERKDLEALLARLTTQVASVHAAPPSPARPAKPPTATATATAAGTPSPAKAASPAAAAAASATAPSPSTPTRGHTHSDSSSDGGDIHDSDDDDDDGNNDADAAPHPSSGAGTGPSTTTPPKNRKGSMSFRATKFLSSKLGAGTGAGRATIAKVLGEDGEAVIKAFKRVSTTLDSAHTAKEMKRDAIRMVLKAYNLWRRKEITADNTRELQVQAQMLGEMFVRDANSSRPRGSRTVTHLVAAADRVRELGVRAMRPHIQEKNVVALERVLSYFGSARFIGALLNHEKLEEPCRVIERSTGQMIMSMPSVLLGESEKSTYRNGKELLRVLNKPPDTIRLEQVLDTPALSGMLQELLDLEMGLAPRNALRFFLAVREYERISTRNVMKLRAPKIFDKYLAANGDSFVEGIPSDVLADIRATLDAGNATSSVFSAAVGSVRGALDDDFHKSFLTSKEFAEYRAKLARDIEALEVRLKEQGSLPAGGPGSGTFGASGGLMSP